MTYLKGSAQQGITQGARDTLSGTGTMSPVFATPFRGTLKQTFVRVTVLKDKFIVNGIKPNIGDEIEMRADDAANRQYLGHVRILEGTERVEDTGLRTDPPAYAGGMGWSATKW